jgi:multidrug resistance efflux pump
MRPLALIVLAAGAAGAVAWGIRAGRPGAGADAPDGFVIAEAPFELWSRYEGRLAARRVETVSSRFNGGATIVELAAEGTRVRRGDRLVRFDSFQVENDLARLDREYAVAESELRNLEKAALPLELRELETSLIEARYNHGAEAQYVEDAKDLVKEGLVSAREVERQQLKVDGLRAKIDQTELRLQLLKDHVHPARLEEARAKLDAAARQHALIKEQYAQCTVTSPCDGEVVHLPLPFGTEIRTARVGDTVFKNQEFLCIPDPSEWIVRCEVPEQELGRVSPGALVLLTPRAWPLMCLTGTVESVSAMAQARGGDAGPRCFPASIRVHEAPAEMKSGLSVRAAVLSHRIDRTPVIPRAAVRWEGGEPYARINAPGGPVRHKLKLGPGNEEVFVILDGLRAGDSVLR